MSLRGVQGRAGSPQGPQPQSLHPDHSEVFLPRPCLFWRWGPGWKALLTCQSTGL